MIVVSKTKVEVMDKKGNIVSSYTISSESLADKLKRHGIGTSVEQQQTIDLACKFCNRDSFKSIGGLTLHERTCSLNPRRATIASSICPKCSLSVANRGFDVHVEKCTGDPEILIRRKALRNDLARRKAEASHSGQSYEVLNTGRRKRNVEYRILSSGEIVTQVSVDNKSAPKVEKKVESVKNKVDKQLSFDDLVSVMAEHCAASMGSKYREFLKWVDDSKNLWDSV